MILKGIAIFENETLLNIIHNPILNINELEKIAFDNLKKIKENEKNLNNFLKKENFLFIIITDNKTFDFKTLLEKIENEFFKLENKFNFEFILTLENLFDEIPKKKNFELKNKNFQKEITNLNNNNLSNLLNNNKKKKIKSLNVLYNLTQNLFLKKSENPILENIFFKMPKTIEKNKQIIKDIKIKKKENIKRKNSLKKILHNKLIRRKTLEDTFINDINYISKKGKVVPLVIFREIMNIKVNNINIDEKEIFGEISVKNIENLKNYYFTILNEFWQNETIINLFINKKNIFENDSGIYFQNKNLEKKFLLYKYIINPNYIDKDTIPLMIGFNKNDKKLYLKLNLNKKYNKKISDIELKIEFKNDIKNKKISCTHFGKSEDRFFYILIDKREFLYDRIIIKILVEDDLLEFKRINCYCKLNCGFIPNLEPFLKDLDNNQVFDSFEKCLEINYIVNL